MILLASATANMIPGSGLKTGQLVNAGLPKQPMHLLTRITQMLNMILEPL